MTRLLCTASLALAAISAVSGHVITHRKNPPPGWETSILQSYDGYHERYLGWGCQNQHNTEFFAKCCHPLLKGEDIKVIQDLGCPPLDDGCDDDNSSVPLLSPASPVPPKVTEPASTTHNAPPSAPPATEPTSTPPYVPTTTTLSPSHTPTQPGGGNNGPFTGQATFFTQDNTAGACGKVHSDNDFVAALTPDLYKSGSHCGRTLSITNIKNNIQVNVIVADECPTCTHVDDVDLSVAAFVALSGKEKSAAMAEGTFDIKWHFV